MIVANLATFPPRSQKLEQVVESLLPQVNQLNVVFNQYDDIPKGYRDRDKLNPIIPHEDTKDVGKFYPTVSTKDHVFLVDDDIKYPKDFVKKTLQNFSKLPSGRYMAGYHTSIYKRPVLGATVTQIRRYIAFYLSKRKIARYRAVTSFQHEIKTPYYVHQVGTGALILKGEDMPSYSYMRDSRRFVDVRLARWCFEKNISMVALPREPDWLSSEDDQNSIFHTFTQKHPSHVAEEIWTYAFKMPFVGKPVEGDEKYSDPKLSLENPTK